MIKTQLINESVFSKITSGNLNAIKKGNKQ